MNTKKNKTKHVFKFLTFLILALSYSTMQANQLSILNAARTIFSPDMPGFADTLSLAVREHKPNLGHTFEIETAVVIQMDQELQEKLGPVQGFNLDIQFQKAYPLIYLDGTLIELRTTEYDVVTENYIIECKSGKISKKVDQLLKEQNILKWFKTVYLELLENADKSKDERTINIKINILRNPPTLSIQGISTNGKIVTFYSHWITNNKSLTDDEENLLTRWLSLIEFIAQKKQLYLFSKKPISDPIAHKLSVLSIPFLDSVKYKNYIPTHSKFFERDFALW